jgi:hypothetical protein
VALTVIAIAAAVSVPVIQQAMRDRRLQQSAITFMNTFREARSRATFRGAAQLVRVDLGVTPPLQQIVEGTSSSCLLSTFPTTNVLYTNFDLQNNTDVSIQNLSPSVPYVEFCYTPLGHLFYRYDMSSAFTEDNGATSGLPLAGGFLFRVFNNAYPATTNRRVAVPLGGAPRLTL